mmetsp:Transcript_78034/g.208596  ORF Transcript_78034/g.208596 Transcript_78034/m.208596 type:complete len:231 (-) Transcript_78034:486-1178(-)
MLADQCPRRGEGVSDVHLLDLHRAVLHLSKFVVVMQALVLPLDRASARNKRIAPGQGLPGVEVVHSQIQLQAVIPVSRRLTRAPIQAQPRRRQHVRRIDEIIGVVPDRRVVARGPGRLRRVLQGVLEPALAVAQLILCPLPQVRRDVHVPGLECVVVELLGTGLHIACRDRVLQQDVKSLRPNYVVVVIVRIPCTQRLVIPQLGAGHRPLGDRALLVVRLRGAVHRGSEK